MSTPSVQAQTPGDRPLSEIQRLLNVFTAPTKTFADIRRSARWIVPLLIIIASGVLLVVVASTQLGWEQIQENQAKLSPASQRAQFENATPEQRRQSLGITKTITYAITFVFIPLFLTIVALVLWGTFTFGAGSKVSFNQSMAIVFYASIVGIVRTILAIITLFAGVNPENFFFQNPVGTNAGYYMNPDETSPFLYAIASAIDPVVIWTLVLTAIGFAVVGRVKNGTAYAIVFGWWALVTLASAAMGAMFR